MIRLIAVWSLVCGGALFGPQAPAAARQAAALTTDVESFLAREVGDGADEIHPSADGRELRAIWRRWARIGAKPGELDDPGLSSEVRWSLRDGALDRVETLTARAPIVIRTWRVIVPSTAGTAGAIRDGMRLSGDAGRSMSPSPRHGASTRRSWRPAMRRLARARVVRFHCI